MNIAVLCSGTGTNLQALLDSQQNGALTPARIVLVASNVPGAPALSRAQRAGVATKIIDHREFDSRQGFEGALVDALGKADVEGVVLAGFMRILTDHFVGAFKHRIVNTHPALCPAFPGMHGARQALEHGVKITGCTVHFVDTGVDTGPIIAQSAVDVLPGDDEQRLQARIQAEEHRLLPDVVQKLAAGRLRITGRRVEVL